MDSLSLPGSPARPATGRVAPAARPARRAPALRSLLGTGLSPARGARRPVPPTGARRPLPPAGADRAAPRGADIGPGRRPRHIATGRRGQGDRLFEAYLWAVIVPGLWLFGTAIATDAPQFGHHPALIALFFPVILLGEMFPIRVFHHGEEEEVTISTTFAVALLVLAGFGPAVGAMALASLASDLLRRRQLHRAVFNVAQYTLSLGATVAVLEALSPGLVGRGSLVADDLLALAAAAATYFAVNNTLPAIAIAMTRQLPVLRFLLADVGLQATIAGLALAMVPVVVAVTGTPWVFFPFLLVPVLMVYRSAAARARLAFEAAHDSLTGLANRAELSRRLSAVISQRAGDHCGAVLLIDLDRFKEVNDVLGHAAGDELLRRVADRLRQTVPPGDLIARLGGDEFALLCMHGGEREAAALGQRVLGALGEPVPIGEATITVDASVGIALVAEGTVVADELLRRADVALYEAKRAHSGYQLYERDRDTRSTSGLTLLPEVDGALRRGQFLLHYQPKAAAATGDILGAEALARWEHPTHGLLGPAAFIPLIEQSGLSRQFTCFVIEEALRQARSWQEAGRWLPVAVNLTVRNVHDSRFPDDVAAAVRRSGCDPGLLQLEITEGIMMADPARVLSVLEALAAQGIRLSLDDYGTGYSSLSYLGQLPLDELKIDKSFVKGMADEKHHVAIVRSTIELAHNLGLRCVAEGVEDARTWDQLNSLGCDVIQGYFLSRPQPGSDLSVWLTSVGVAATGNRGKKDRRPDTGRPGRGRGRLPFPIEEIDIRDPR